MTRIDTNELREAIDSTGSDGLYASFLCDIASEAADELDRLCLDHTPLSREELETVLKEDGCRRKGQGVDGGNRYVTRGRKNQVVIIVQDTTVDIYGREDIIIENLPLSAVTRAMLRSCGVIK